VHQSRVAVTRPPIIRPSDKQARHYG